MMSNYTKAVQDQRLPVVLRDNTVERQRRDSNSYIGGANT